jgi:hypothetical protein
MRKLVILLAFTTATLAGTTWYLAQELSLERAHSASLAATQNSGSVPAPGFGNPANAASAPRASSDTAKSGPQVSGAVTRIGQMTEEEAKKAHQDYSRRFLAQLGDPQGREELLSERRMMMRNSYPRVAQVLGLSPEEYAQFIELSALEQIDMQEATSRCSLDPACNMQELFRDRADSRAAEIRNLLGQERLDKLATYKNTMGEREVVTQLRSRLPDAQRLSDDKAESLVAALAEERESMHREAAQQGTGLNGYGMGAGMIFSPNDGRSLEERYEVAKQYSQRLRDRAALVLNGEQLRAFNEMQDETLLGLRSMMRNKDSQSFTTVTIAQ